jgi:hypothetical protein
MGKTFKTNISIIRLLPQLVLVAAIMAGLLILPTALLATERLTDKEIEDLMGNIESGRSAFEAALDNTQKNSVLKGPRGNVDTNEFLDDLQDQVTRTRERFNSDYSASSEVISLLQYSTRLDRWVKSQTPGFKGSAEWGPLATSLSRLAKAYNTTMPMPENGGARRFNDAELKAAADDVEKLCDPFRAELEASLNADKSLTPEARQSILQQVDLLKSNANALNASLANNQKGEAEADALIKQALVVTNTVAKTRISSGASAAWNPLRGALGKVAWSYEVNVKTLPYSGK